MCRVVQPTVDVCEPPAAAESLAASDIPVLPDRERARRISAVIRFSEKRLRRRFPLLNRQDLLGATIFAASAAGFVVTSVFYLRGLIPAWACVVANAFFASILHELEHDLIHGIYFRSKPIVQNAMMLGVWAFRGNIINPWYRRRLHLLHHKDSGQHTDLEEQLIGLGQKYGIIRFLAMFDGLLSVILRGPHLYTIPAYRPIRLGLATLPFMPLFSAMWYGWLYFHGWTLAAPLFGTTAEFSPWFRDLIPALNGAVVIYVLPNVLRQACINIVSSSMHYFGDVDGVVHQTQILRPWFLMPLQLFCFNFGSTHGIHHFVVTQPFYLRQMVAAPAHAAMRKYGVRENDLGTFRRANRLNAASVA